MTKLQELSTTHRWVNYRVLVYRPCDDEESAKNHRHLHTWLSLLILSLRDLRSSSSSSRWRCGQCLSSPAGPRCSGSPAPSGSRRGKPECRSGKGISHRPSTPRTHHISHQWEAVEEKKCYKWHSGQLYRFGSSFQLLKMCLSILHHKNKAQKLK